MTRPTQPRCRFLNLTWLLILGILTGLIWPLSSLHAAMPDTDYLAALKIADAKVVRQRSRAHEVNRLVLAPLFNRLSGRVYKVGDSWEVVAFPLQTAIMKKTSEDSNLVTRAGAGVVLKYQVISVEPGQTRIRIQPVERLGLKPQTGALGTTVELVLDDDYRTITQTFSRPPAPSRTSVLELLPLTLPDLKQADPAETTMAGQLPDSILEFARSHHLSLEQTGGLSYLADDPFGRGIQLGWSKGELWPSFIRTQNGVAFLLKEAS